MSWIGVSILLDAHEIYAGNSEIAESIEHAQRLLGKGENREAANLLKRSLADDPASGPVARFLAATYLSDGNAFWALKILYRHAALTSDPETLSWIAWIHLQKGKLNEAQEALEAAGNRVPDPTGCRIHLLRAMLYRTKGEDRRALRELEMARERSKMFVEDDRLMSHLEASLDPGRISPFTFGVSLGVGWESNVSQSSIVEGLDPQSSFLVELDHDGRLVMPTHGRISPELDYRIRLRGFPGGQDSHGSDQVWDLSNGEFSGRAGVILGKAMPRLGLYYSSANLVMAGDYGYDSGMDAYSETQRGEFELEVSEGILLFGGAGRKIFREQHRTRNEADLVLAMTKALTERVSLTGVLAQRRHDAVAEAYDLWGGSALVLVGGGPTPGWVRAAGILPILRRLSRVRTLGILARQETPGLDVSGERYPVAFVAEGLPRQSQLSVHKP